VNTTHLLLARVDINYSTTFDRVTFWVDPNLAGGEAGLGQIVGDTNGPLYVGSGIDVMGNAFDGIGMSFNNTGTNTVDAIRISNDATGFTDVTTGTPEPGSIGLAGVGLGGMLLRRRRRVEPSI
jgi:hypothetical protein